MFIAAVITIVTAIVIAIVAKMTDDAPIRFASLGVLTVGVGLMLAASVSIVPPRTVGVPVTFGKVGQSFGSGINMHAPWTTVVYMDGTIQALDASGDNPTMAKDRDKADIYVHNNVRWSIKQDRASELYLDYKKFEGVGDLLVQPALREAIAFVMQDFDPLADDNPSLTDIAEDVKIVLDERLGDKINIHSVSITLLDPSQATKDRINALNVERGNTRIAEQKRMTAAAEAEANKIIAESVSDPNVLVSKCLDMIDESRPLPAGFQCWPGTGGSVVIPQG